MNFIIKLFEKIFKKKNNIKMIKQQSSKTNNSNFINELKTKTKINKKNEVETRTCIGDGLGIQKKITF